MSVLAAIAEGLAVALGRLAGDAREAERRAELRARHGVCGWCGELLLQPIHDTDCPARVEDERELMRGRE